MAKAKNIRLNTPEGVAKFPWLTTPDTRFNEAGEYKVTLVLPADDEATQKLIEKIEKVYETFRKTLKGAKLKRKPDSLGFEPEYTDDGDETGNILFKFKSKTGYTNKAGEFVKMNAPKLFDSKLQELPKDTVIWGGSTMIVNFSPSAYDHGKNLGVTLRLNACQIIQLNNGGEKSAGDYGFGEQEGYTQASDMQADTEEYEEPEVEAEDEGTDEDDF